MWLLWKMMQNSTQKIWPLWAPGTEQTTRALTWEKSMLATRSLQCSIRPQSWLVLYSLKYFTKSVWKSDPFWLEFSLSANWKYSKHVSIFPTLPTANSDSDFIHNVISPNGKRSPILWPYASLLKVTVPALKSPIFTSSLKWK